MSNAPLIATRPAAPPDDDLRPLDARRIQYAISAPFERLARLTAKIETRRPWHRVDRDVTFFACDWKPKCQVATRHFSFIRTRELHQREEPVQLHLFVHYAYEHQFKVILTNAAPSAPKLLELHNGRAVNLTRLVSTVAAYSLNGELQLTVEQPAHSTTEQPTPWWSFSRLDTSRTPLSQRDGCLTEPNGRLASTLSANLVTRTDQFHALKAAA